MILVIHAVTIMFYMPKKVYLWILLLPLFATFNCKKSNNSSNNSPGSDQIKDSVLVSGLNFPWEILWGPDNFIWMTERGGKISRVNPTTGEVIPVLTVSEVVSTGEGGMLGMVLHPDFANT